MSDAIGKRVPHELKVVKRALADGRQRTYRYYRPTMQRLYHSPGSAAFEVELEDARRSRAKAAPGVMYLYFVHAARAGAIKIGSAADPYRRLQILQVGSPDVITLLGWIKYRQGELLERNIHGLFKKLRVRGEWFRDDPVLHEFIAKRCRL